MPYSTIARRATIEETVRRSRFLAMAAPLAEPDGAAALVAAAAAEHPQASHHCWASRFGQEMRFDDAGEPAGTAGRPMLEVLLKRDLDRVAVVVVRYFGGTKLGAGGLVRAYAGSVAKVLDVAGERLVEETVRLRLAAPFTTLDVVHRLLADVEQLRLLEEGFDAQGWRATIELPASGAGRLRERIADSTRGTVQLLPGTE